MLSYQRVPATSGRSDLELDEYPWVPWVPWREWGPIDRAPRADI